MPHASTPGVPDEAWSLRSTDRPTASEPIALAGYRDFVLVGTGGDSQVYRATQELVNRPVAVKVMNAGEDGMPVSRFRRELEITVRLGRSHPNIVTVLDTQVLPDGRPCIVMEYYELGSLQDQLRLYGPLPASAVVAAGTVVADALAFAHADGVLHRDVKPQNILVLPTSYVLADFGLARRMDAGHTSSLERFSYRHASPQVLDGELPTVADDIYSLGSTLFTLLDGRPPFAADDPEDDSALSYLRRVRTELPRPIRSSDATPELLAIIDRCLSKQREERFPDAASLRDALRGVVTEARVWARTWQPQVLPGRDDATPMSPPPMSPPPISPPPMSPPPMSPRSPVEPPPSSPASPRRPTSPAPRPVSGPARDLAAATTASVPRIDEPTGQAQAWAPRRATSTAESGPLDWAFEGKPGRDDAGDDDSVGLGQRRTGWLRIAVMAVVALVAGIALGLGGSWVVGRFGSGESGQPPDQPSPLPIYTGALPTVSQSLNPALSPQITALVDLGDRIRLSWTDPSGGRFGFAVLVTPNGGDMVPYQAAPGQTTLEPPVQPEVSGYCFVVVVVGTDLSDGFGASPSRCLTR